MNSARLRMIFSVAALAVASWLSLGAARAQETWQPAHGGASSWGAGKATSGNLATRSSASGSSSSWIAGKGSFASASQPGGVWTDGSATPGAASKIPAKSIAGRTLRTSQIPKRAAVSAAPAAGRMVAQKSKAQIAHAPTGLHASTGPHFGMANGGHGGAFKFTSAKPTASSTRSSAAPSSRSEANPGLGLPMLDEPVSDPFASSSPGNGLGTAASSGLDETSH